LVKWEANVTVVPLVAVEVLGKVIEVGKVSAERSCDCINQWHVVPLGANRLSVKVVAKLFGGLEPIAATACSRNADASHDVVADSKHHTSRRDQHPLPAATAATVALAVLWI